METHDLLFELAVEEKCEYGIQYGVCSHMHDLMSTTCSCDDKSKSFWKMSLLFLLVSCWKCSHTVHVQHTWVKENSKEKHQVRHQCRDLTGKRIQRDHYLKAL